MRIQKIIIYLLLFLSFQCGEMYGRGFKYKKHYATLWGSAGYSLLDYSTNSFEDGRLGAALGAGFTWKFENEYFFTSGVELQYLSSQMYSADLIQSDREMVDTDISPYSTFTMHTSMGDYKELDKVYYVNFTPSFGYRFDNGRYLMGGLKVGYSLQAGSKSKTDVTTTAEYEWFVDDFSDMPDHFLVNNQETTGTSTLNFGINVAATLEYGVELKIESFSKSENMLRAGIFVDYGFLDINKNTANNTAVFSHTDDPTQFDFHSIMTTKTSGDDPLNTMYVGAKLTYYFLTKKICSCKEGQTQHQGKYKPKR